MLQSLPCSTDVLFTFIYAAQIFLETAALKCLHACRNCGRVVDNWDGSALGRALRTDIRCEGSESSLADCRYGLRSQDDVTASHHCTQSVNHVAVSCQQCHAITRRSRRNPLMPYSSNAGASSSNSGGNMSLNTVFRGGGIRRCPPRAAHLIVFKKNLQAQCMDVGCEVFCLHPFTADPVKALHFAMLV